MNRPRAVAAVALLVGLAAPLDAQDAGRRLSGKFLLRFHPPAGARYGTVLEQEVRMRADTAEASDLAEQHVRTRIYAVRTVTGPAAGGAGIAVAARIDSAFAEAELPAGGTHREELRALRGTTGGLTYDERMRLMRANFADRSVAETFKAFEVCAFPERAVAAGDSWDDAVAVPMELPGLNEPITLDVRLTLREIRLEGDDTTIVITLAFRMPDKPLRVREGDAEFAMTFKGAWSGELRFSITRGATVAMDVGGSIRVEIANARLLAQPVAMRMDQRLSHRLLASAALPSRAP